MDGETLCRQIRDAIAVNVNPQASIEERQKSAAFIEQVQNCDSTASAMMLEIGFRMIIPQESDAHLQVNYVHFGFQLIEGAIKRSWNQFDATTKSQIKAQFEQLITQSSFKHRHLKDCLSRCIVEVMFREWPQNWPQLLPLLLGKLLGRRDHSLAHG